MTAEQRPLQKSPRFQVETPDDWDLIRTHPDLSRQDIKRLLARTVWPNGHTRAAIRDQLEEAVSAAREAQAMLLMLRVAAIPREASAYELFVGSLSLAAISTYPDQSELSMIVDGLEGLEGDVSQFITPAGVEGRALVTVENSGSTLGSIRPELREVVTAQVYLPVPDTSWIALATCTLNGAHQRDLAVKCAARIANSLEILETASG